MILCQLPVIDLVVHVRFTCRRFRDTVDSTDFDRATLRIADASGVPEMMPVELVRLRIVHTGPISDLLWHTRSLSITILLERRFRAPCGGSPVRRTLFFPPVFKQILITLGIQAVHMPQCQGHHLQRCVGHNRGPAKEQCLSSS